MKEINNLDRLKASTNKEVAKVPILSVDFWTNTIVAEGVDRGEPANVEFAISEGNTRVPVQIESDYGIVLINLFIHSMQHGAFTDIALPHNIKIFVIRLEEIIEKTDLNSENKETILSDLRSLL